MNTEIKKKTSVSNNSTDVSLIGREKKFSGPLFLVYNIPKTFHSFDLRNFFQEFIEKEYFQIFHFKHRPQILLNNSKINSLSSSSFLNKDKCCCIVVLTEGTIEIGPQVSATIEQMFIKKYQDKTWVNSKGERLVGTCQIQKIKSSPVISLSKNQDQPPKYLSKREKQVLQNQKDGEFVSLWNLPELNPPNGLPRGNVGTPSHEIHKSIDQCLLPSECIKKLGITKFKPSSKALSNYNEMYYGYEKEKNSKEKIESDDEEEWERHEAINGEEEEEEYLYENDIELKWEKGGSGLVFYTDAFYRDQLKGDFDERNTDQWDLEPIYSETSMHDDETTDFDVEEEMWNSFEDSYSQSVGFFEKHTKAIGSKIMKNAGWNPNLGLGPKNDGILSPIEPSFQKTKKGIGFNSFLLPKKIQKKRNSSQPHLIRTIYDKKDLPKQTSINDQHSFHIFQFPSEKPSMNFLFGGTLTTNTI